ncbi:hypothetical protein LCX93_04935 [Sulfurimonas sp. SWIR-19]|uniref:hypothetical protein n=1 Tax=Sulfurimonas sp. SWIR-19 TaxID=2878390 RepID=UPI001CF46995|nr:hypothetical protein [Sulfurimonas sp. SWIR-19]UCN01263.1 hypothetical protein LCX93_04935 [Sulfurimonas sp. SWIR-19]
MSQFSNKYYKNNYKLEEQKPKKELQDDYVWTFWRLWGLYEYLVLFLLGVIIVLLLMMMQKQPTALVVTQTPQQQVYEKPLHVTEQISEQKELSKESYFPKKILPSEITPNSPLKMEDYLYFADDVDDFYPAFFDEKSRKSIKSSRCQNADCILSTQDIDPIYIATYIAWLKAKTAKKFTYKIKNNNYYIQKEK